MMKHIVSYGIDVNFTMECIYDGAHSRLLFMYIYPWMEFDGAHSRLFVDVHFAMDGIYDGAHCRLCYLCKFYHLRYL